MFTTNNNTDYDVHGSSSFVEYKEYANSSCIGFISVNLVYPNLEQKEPNEVTLDAIKEAADTDLLDSFNSVEDFFNDLEV